MIRISLSLFSLVICAIFLLQTPFAKNFCKEKLVLIAKERGIDLSVEKVDGILPFEWTLKNVKCSYKGESISSDVFKFRLAILPLIQKELEISYLKFQGGLYEDIPFGAVGKAKLDLTGIKPIKVSHFLIEGEELFIRLEGKITPDLSIQEGNLAFYLPDLSIFKTAAKGSCLGMAKVTLKTAQIECFGENLVIEDIPLAYSSFTVDAQREENIWEGTAQIASGHKEVPLDAKWKFSFNPINQLLFIRDFQLTGPGLSLAGKMDFSPELQGIQGSFIANCLDLEVLRPLFPTTYVKGSASARFDLQSSDLDIQIKAENFALFDSSCETLLIETTIHDLHGAMHGQLALRGNNLSLPQMALSELEIKSTIQPQSSPFEFAVRGTWKDSLEIIGNGSWQRQLNGAMFNVNGIDGFALKKPFSLQTPFVIDWDGDHFKISNFLMEVGYGQLSAQIDLNKTTSMIKMNAKEFPLEFIPLPKKYISLTGTSTFDIDLNSWENHIQGTCNAAVQRATFQSEGLREGFATKGSIQIHLNDTIAQVHAELKAKESQFISFFGKFPIQYQHYPFQIALNSDEPFAAELIAEGKLEDLFNFINVGQHRIEGWVSTKLHAFKTLKDPSFQGNLEVQDGVYENYYSGTCLREIYATALADKKTLHLTALKANDGSKGTCTAEGLIHLNPTEHFPYMFAAELDNLNTISFDTIVGNFTGQVIISGDTLGAIARGKIKVSEATFRIPDQLPSILPELPIRFINPPDRIAKRAATTPSSSPFHLDIEAEVPKKVRVEGRGLNAELKGNLHLTGTPLEIIAKGQLQLVSGEYIFSGKVFKLTGGELIFSDQPTPSAYMSLTGNCDLPEVNVTVTLQGPLTSPKLSFQSSPQLPTSSLLSQILFNKDISEISAIQALQVAQTVISLSGNSAPDLLEKIRKTIGIDRLTIITSETDPGKISLQIGKYLMRGVLLTVSQGAESRNVSVEVDLKRGIKFQAEFNEEQQGKFSLKWHHHY